MYYIAYEAKDPRFLVFQNGICIIPFMEELKINKPLVFSNTITGFDIQAMVVDLLNYISIQSEETGLKGRVPAGKWTLADNEYALYSLFKDPITYPEYEKIVEYLLNEKIKILEFKSLQQETMVHNLRLRLDEFLKKK